MAARSRAGRRPDTAHRGADRTIFTCAPRPLRCSSASVQPAIRQRWHWRADVLALGRTRHTRDPGGQAADEARIPGVILHPRGTSPAPHHSVVRLHAVRGGHGDRAHGHRRSARSGGRMFLIASVVITLAAALAIHMPRGTAAERNRAHRDLPTSDAESRQRPGGASQPSECRCFMPTTCPQTARGQLAVGRAEQCRRPASRMISREARTGLGDPR